MTVATKDRLTKAHAGSFTKLKAGKGEARIAFAQIGVVDHDGDYTFPGAFQIGQKVKVCQTGHAHGKRVAGAGEIVGEETAADGSVWAIADIKFLLNTEAGREEYETAKGLDELGHTQEWSYGYDTLDAMPVQVDGRAANGLKQQSVYEVSPVLRGAGIGTHTLGIKGQKAWNTDAVYRAWRESHPYVEGEAGSWVCEIQLDPHKAIVEQGGDMVSVPFAVDDAGTVEFDEEASVEVVRAYVPKSTKGKGSENCDTCKTPMEQCSCEPPKAKAETCETCGQDLPDEDAKAAEGVTDEPCEECGKDPGQCGCEKSTEDPDLQKGRADQLAASFMAIKARRLGVPLD